MTLTIEFIISTLELILQLPNVVFVVTAAKLMLVLKSGNSILQLQL